MLTIKQAVVISAYTGVLCCEFRHLHEYVEKLFDRPVWTHEMGSDEFAKKLKELSKPEFLEICSDV